MRTKMNDGFVPLSGSRHMQEEELRHETELARRCETGRLSSAEVIEDYPFEPESAFVGVPVEHTPPSERRVERGAECDLQRIDNEAAFKGRITPPWYEYDEPHIGRKAITGPWYENDRPGLG